MSRWTDEERVGGARPAPAATGGERLALHLKPEETSVGEAREAVGAFLAAARCPRRFVFEAKLVVSELVGNAVAYGAADEAIELRLELAPAALHVAVENAGDPIAMKTLRRGRESGGRGLEIVDALASAWSISAGDRRTIVAARLARPR